MQDQALIRSMPFRFTGKASEYFRIWIVNIFLSIVTIGIYSAWAKVRSLRYFYGNTWLDDNNFSYLANPIQILKGRIIAVIALAVYFFSWEIFPTLGFWFLALGVLLFPALIVLAMSFKMNNSAYRSIRFSFRKDFVKVYTAFLIPALIILGLTWLSYTLLNMTDFMTTLEEVENSEFKKEDLLPTIFIFILLPFFPYLDYLKTRVIVDHITYGKNEASFAAGGWNFYSIYLIAFVTFFVVIMVASMGLGVLLMAFGLVSDTENTEKAAIPAVILFSIVIYGLSFVLYAYLRAARTNMIYSNTFFGEDTFISRLKTLPIAWLYLSNTVAILCSLGLLIPWAQVRMAHYVADNTEFESRSLDNILATEDSKQSAVGEEVGEAFDLDIGL